MANNKPKAKFGLVHKITLLILVLIVLIMGVVSYFSIFQEEHMKHMEMDKRMTDTANMIAALKLIEPLAGEKVAWPIFREFIKVIRNLDSNILYISILAKDGEVKVFTLNPATAAALDSSLEGIEVSPESLNRLTQHTFPPGATARISGDIIVENKRVATVNLRFSLLALKREIMLAKIRNILMTFVMMILGFGGALWLSKTVTRPIGNLTAAMARVARGDLGVTAEVQSRDEIGLLTECFNLMVQDLKEKVRIKGAFDVVADELKDVEKIKEAFQLYICKEAQERFVDTNALVLTGEKAKRHRVTVLFADLGYLVQQTSTQDAASMSRILETYFRRFMATLFEYGGQIYKFSENIFMAVFGITSPHSDDDQRAILTAVNMQKSLAELNKERIRKNETPLYVSLGVASGEVQGSLMTPKGLMPMGVIKDYLDFTRKMSSQPFSVVMVAGDIFQRASNLVRGEKIEELQLSDSGELLEVYRITGAKF
ncbi:adenylate/guanylate cyclase domain-containing protein [bacterium]|nr:adenylate/guanylate cyclase domain-containing protein [bacterium]